MAVGQGVDELHIHPHLIARFLHAAFDDVHHSKLLRNLGKVIRRALEVLRRSARNHFQVGNFRQAGENFILHSFAEVSVVRITTEIVERQDGNRLCR